MKRIAFVRSVAIALTGVRAYMVSVSEHADGYAAPNLSFPGRIRTLIPEESAQ